MLFYCRFTWYAGTSRDDVIRRVIQQDEAGTNNPDRIKGWYTLAGGGAGFLLLEANTPEEVSVVTEPYMDLMSWDCHVVSENSYAEAIAGMKKEL